MTSFANHIRRMVLEQSKRAGAGHIGSSLSIADIIGALYENVANIPSPDDTERDRIILSKGHAALAQYAAFCLKGWITEDMLNSYAADNSKLCVHPEHHVKGVDFSSGSLGQGLSCAVGAALAAKMQKSARHTYCIISDAELNEGSIWEALFFAAHHALSNLTIILDCNGQQALGYTKDIINMAQLPHMLEAANLTVTTVDGHDIQALTTAMKHSSPKPHFIIANTISGKGVSYMENTILWHYKSMSDEEYHIAINELGE